MYREEKTNIYYYYNYYYIFKWKSQSAKYLTMLSSSSHDGLKKETKENKKQLLN